MEIPVPELIKAKVLNIVGDDLVLVGGHSLAFWMSYFDVESPIAGAAISNDIDFLAAKSSDTMYVKRIADSLKARAIIPGKLEMTALVGSVQGNVTKDDFYQIDIIFKVYGTDANLVRKNAIKVDLEGTPRSLKVMHPIHVLKSRLDNLHGLPEKKSPERIENSFLQLHCAIQVAERYLESVAATPRPETSTRDLVLPYVQMIFKLANDDAGKKIATRHGIHVADAINPNIVRSPEFHENHVARITALMSPNRLRALALDARAKKNEPKTPRQ